MRKLGEQWIEVIDGVRHMMKVVKGDGITTCMGCFYFDNYDKDCKNPVGEVQCSEGIIIDLGPVNEDGCLAEERTGLFPEIANKFDLFAMDSVWVAEFQYADSTGMIIQIQIRANTKQECIDAWNRRAR